MSSEEILDFIRLKKKQGLSKEQINQRLQDAGWDEKDINDSLNSFEFNNKKTNTNSLGPKKAFAGLALIIVLLLLLTNKGSDSKQIDAVIIPEATIPPAKINNKEGEYTNKYNTFTITKPLGWQVDDSQRFGVDVIFSSPSPDTVDGIKFISNINIYTTPTNLKSLLSFANSNQQKYQDKFDSYQELSKKDIFLDNKPSIQIISSYSSDNISLTQNTVYSQHNGIFFLITATAPTGLYNRYQTIFDNSISSLKLW